MHVVLQESPPCLRWRLLLANSVFIDRGIGDVVPEKENFRFDPRCSPGWVLLGHLAYQFSEFRIDLGPTASSLPRFPAPVQFETLSMPTDDCIGLHNDQRRFPS